MKQSYTYNFRVIKAGSEQAAKLDAQIAELASTPATAAQATAIADQFELVKEGKRTKEGRRRKALTVELTMPEFFDLLPDQFTKDLVTEAVANYVKSQYVEDFLPVGPHDWADIVKAAAESGVRGASAPEADAEQLKVGESVFAAYLAEAMPKAAKRLAGIIERKSSKNFLLRVFGDNYGGQVLDLLRSHMEKAIELLAGEEDEDSADARAAIRVALHEIKKQSAALAAASLSLEDLGAM